MPTMQLNQSASGGGIAIAGSHVRAADGICARQVALPAGSAGTLSSRSGSASGVATVPSDHGVIGGDFLDVYWAGGGGFGYEVSHVTSTTITFSGVPSPDSGPLPAQDSEIVVAKQVRLNLPPLGDNLVALALLAEASSRAAWFDASDTWIVALELLAGVAKLYDVAGGVANPFDGEQIAYGRLSSRTAAGGAFSLIASHDATP